MSEVVAGTAKPAEALLAIQTQRVAANRPQVLAKAEQAHGPLAKAILSVRQNIRKENKRKREEDASNASWVSEYSRGDYLRHVATACNSSGLAPTAATSWTALPGAGDLSLVNISSERTQFAASRFTRSFCNATVMTVSDLKRLQ